MRSAFTSVPLQLDPGLEPLLDEIVEARAPVLGDDLGLVEFGDGRLGTIGPQISPAWASAASTAFL